MVGDCIGKIKGKELCIAAKISKNVSDPVRGFVECLAAHMDRKVDPEEFTELIIIGMGCLASGKCDFRYGSKVLPDEVRKKGFEIIKNREEILNITNSLGNKGFAEEFQKCFNQFFG